jgi:hypothetical protein
MSKVIRELATYFVTDAVYQNHELMFRKGDAELAQHALKRQATKAEVAEVRKALEVWGSLSVKDRNEDEGWVSLHSWAVMPAWMSRTKPKMQETCVSFGPVIRNTMNRSEDKKKELIEKMVGWASGDTTDFVTADDLQEILRSDNE